jgi:acetyl coenzyme A synthetase (ADP forming)-like protein
MTELDFFFKPRSIAVLGASSKPGKIGYEIVKSILDGGFEGNLYPVNLKGGGILGLAVQESILDIPEEVDLAVFTLPAKYTPSVMEECGKKGVKGAVIISGGFKELNGEGVELEKETVKVAKKYGIRIIGPNCVGILSLESGFDTFFQPRYAMSRPEQGNISVLTQSGTFGLSILECFTQDHLGVSKFVSYGNKADVDELDMLRYLDSDPNTKIIVFYIEGLEKGKEFMELAAEIGKRKPIVMLKAGRTKSGAAAAKSHTGSLAGNDAVFTGAMRQSGVILVCDIDEIVDCVKILSSQPLPGGCSVAMITNGVGPSVIAADEIEVSKNLCLSELSDETISRLKEKLPDYCVFSNPLDITGSATASWYKHAMEMVRMDPGVDILMPFFVFQDAPLSKTIEELHDYMKHLPGDNKPMLCVALGGVFTEAQITRLQRNRIPCVPTPRRAVFALDRVAWYAQFRREKS